jgi:hypothetical protein
MVTTPHNCNLCAVYTTSGATGDLTTTETLQHVDLSSEGYEKFTVYEITDATKRYLSKSAVPVFEADIGGAGIYSTVSPTKIEYAGGRIYLATARGATDKVRCVSGKYFTTITALLGGSVSRLTYSPTLVEVPLLGDSYVRRFPTVTDWSFSVDAYKCKGVAEFSTTDGANKDLTFYHAPGGTAGNSYSIKLTTPVGAGSIIVAVAGTDVEVTLAATAGPVLTSTANDVMAAINADGACADIGFRARLATGSTGVGIMTDQAKQSLTGGLNAQDHTAKNRVPLIVIFYTSTSGDARYEGYAYLETIDFNYDPKSVQLETLNFKGTDWLCRRTA